jgi:hypothetical protein
VMTLRELGRAVAAGSNAGPRHRFIATIFATIVAKLVLPKTSRAA